MSSPMTSLELRSTITSDGLLRVTLENVPVQEPGPGQLLVRIEAAPINPSDLGLLFGPADMTPLQAGGTADAPVLEAHIPEQHRSSDCQLRIFLHFRRLGLRRSISRPASTQRSAPVYSWKLSGASSHLFRMPSI
ncbi:hypothetical protein D3C85_1058700 [compost metagenome]